MQPDTSARARIERLCLALPEATGEGGQHVGYKVRGRTFAWLTEDHHGDGRLSVTCKAPPGAQQALVAADPERWFVPPYLGPRGWLGLHLDTPEVDWAEVAELVTDSYRLVAPRRLAAEILPRADDLPAP
jgi:predicted DNA-binding protein (MmcQ/YjbR family)